ncbi:hypothetical protein NQ315_017483 [Exocentrus adspersus]|uniref:Tyr recombinase domain-containing protein n=1 Tax=Exocentrus adspersus TaxID=1586481 RepID=A0AAV8VJN5_9CUCU|nr:hypothetical protein NQ315_017483 [Exocentrus adspersus]
MDHALLVNVRNTKNNVDRNFIINNSNKNGMDLIEVCRKYMALRKPETTHSRFFVRVCHKSNVEKEANDSLLANESSMKHIALMADSLGNISLKIVHIKSYNFAIYCFCLSLKIKAVGRCLNIRNNPVLFKPLEKTLGKIPQKVAEYLNLPNSTLYTGHCFRRTSASLLADSGASIDVLKRHGGWKSASVAEGYIENSINTKKIVADSIFGLGVGNSTESASAHQVSGSAVSASSASSTSSKNNIVPNTIDGANRLLNIVNCSNVNIHVNINTNNKDL